MVHDWHCDPCCQEFRSHSSWYSELRGFNLIVWEGSITFQWSKQGRAQRTRVKRPTSCSLLKNAHENCHKRNFPGGAVDEESACQPRGHGFHPCSRKILHAAACVPQLLGLRSKARKPQLLSLHAATPEARALKRLCSVTAMRSPCTATRELVNLCPLQLEKACEKQRRPGAASN